MLNKFQRCFEIYNSSLYTKLKIDRLKRVREILSSSNGDDKYEMMKVINAVCNEEKIKSRMKLIRPEANINKTK